MIGSVHAYLSHTVIGVWSSQVSNLNFPYLDTVLWLDTHMILTSITLYAHFNGFLSQCLLQFLKLVKSVTGIFTRKKFSKDILNSKIFYRFNFKN